MDLHALNPVRSEPEHEHAEVIRMTARQIWSAENALDAALRETALLIVSTIDGRIAAGLAPGAVQKALCAVGTTQTGLFATRASLQQAHAELARVQVRMGAGGLKLGGLNKPEHDDAETGWPRASAHVVEHPAAAAA